MIYLNKRNSMVYRWLMASFNVETQRHHEVYMHMETGAILNCDSEEFHHNFKRIVDNPQEHIVPNVDYDNETNDPTDKEFANETPTRSDN